MKFPKFLIAFAIICTQFSPSFATTLNSDETLDYTGGTLSGNVDGASYGDGTFNVKANLTLGSSNDLGSSEPNTLGLIEIFDGNILDSGSNSKAIRAVNIFLHSGASLIVGDGALTGTVDGSSTNYGTVTLSPSANRVINASLGLTNGLAAVNINSSGVNTSFNNSIHASQVNISGADAVATLNSSVGIYGEAVIGSTSNLFLNNGSFVTGTIRGDSAGNGTVQISSGSDITTYAAIGTSTFNLGNLTLEGSTTLTTTYDINASSIDIGSSATLTSSSIINGNITLSNNSILNLHDGANVSGVIGSGGILFEGIINTSGAVTILSDVGDGSGAPIESINVLSASQLRIGNSDGSHVNTIDASNVNITGELYLLDATTITSDVTMIGSSSKINFGGYSQTIDGSFTTASGSTLSSTIHSTSSLDSLTVSGVAILDSNTKLALTVGAVTPGTRYILMTAGDGSTLNTISNSNIDVDGSGHNKAGRYIFSTSLEGNSLILNATLASFNAASSNGSDAYNAIANANTSSGTLYALQNYIYGDASDSAKNAALDSAMPQVDNSSNRVIFNDSSASFDLISNRLTALRNSSDISAMQASADLKPKNPFHRFDVDPNNFATKPDYKNSIWSQAFGSNISQGNNSVASGYNANLRGIAFGFDRKIEKNLFLGISGSYANSNVKSHNQLKKVAINSYQLNFYSGHYFDKFYINNLAGFVWNEYNTSRAIPVASSVALAQYSGQTYLVRSEAGKNFKLPQDYVLTPTFMVTAAHNVIDNYRENNAGTLNLNVKTSSSNFFETRGGIALKNSFQFNDVKIDPTIFASYGYDFAAAKQKTTSNFVGQSSTFDSTSANLSQGSFKSGLITRIYQQSAMAFDLNYTFEKRINYRANSVGLKAIWWF